jgi:DNA-binding transcriptional LysR family regulator
MKVFLAVAREETLSKAGKRLRMDPATVGRRVSRLENSYAAPLFQKSPTGYALTEMGQRLLDHAARVEQSMQMAAEEMSGETGRLTGQIRIGAPDGCANFLLPQVCSAISDENPQLDIQIVALPRVISLSKREADFVIAVSPPTAGRLMVQKITDYKLCLAGASAYLDSHPTVESPKDLPKHRIVGYIPDMIFDKELDYLDRVGIERPQLSSNSVAVQANWIRQGGGLGIVHDFSLPFFPDIRKILTDQVSLTRGFYLVRHADDKRLERLNRFAEALCNGLKREVARLEALT